MRRLFLRGEIGCGKSTLIKTALGGRIFEAGGFVTARVLDGGRLMGFELRGLSEIRGRRFLDFSGDGAERDDSVFTGYGAKLLGEAEEHSFAVLDEIGGLELMLPEFYSALTAFLETKTPCVGVLKSQRAAGELAGRMALGGDYLKKYLEFCELLQRDSETEILETFGRGDSNAAGALRLWARRYGGASGD